MINYILTLYFAINTALAVALFLSFRGKYRANDILALILCVLFGALVLMWRYGVTKFKKK